MSGLATDVKKMLQEAERRGWFVVWARGRARHFKCYYHGHRVIVSCTPKYPRALKNAEADFKRVERAVAAGKTLQPGQL